VGRLLQVGYKTAANQTPSETNPSLWIPAVSPAGNVKLGRRKGVAVDYGVHGKI